MASITYSWAFLVTQKVKNLPAMWETWVCPWVRKIPWRKGQYSYLENPHGQRSLAGYSTWGRAESDTTERLSTLHILAFLVCFLFFTMP